MVTELKEVISTIEKLKDEEQREIAKMLNDEMNWDTTLQNSQEKLNNLAQIGRASCRERVYSSV